MRIPDWVVYAVVLIVIVGTLFSSGSGEKDEPWGFRDEKTQSAPELADRGLDVVGGHALVMLAGDGQEGRRNPGHLGREIGLRPHVEVVLEGVSGRAGQRGFNHELLPLSGVAIAGGDRADRAAVGRHTPGVGEQGERVAFHRRAGGRHRRHAHGALEPAAMPGAQILGHHAHHRVSNEMKLSQPERFGQGDDVAGGFLDRVLAGDLPALAVAARIGKDPGEALAIQIIEDRGEDLVVAQPASGDDDLFGPIANHDVSKNICHVCLLKTPHHARITEVVAQVRGRMI